MPKAAKETSRANGVKSADSAAESETDALKRALKEARGEVMRGQADLEASRLELQEHKRRSAQQALVAGEALREARRERDDLRGQLEALRHNSENGKKRRRDSDDDDRAQKLEAELEQAREDLDAAHAASGEAAELRVQIAQLQSQLAESRGALEKAQKDVEAARASVPPPPAAMVAEQAAAEPGFFGKLFGRRR